MIEGASRFSATSAKGWGGHNWRPLKYGPISQICLRVRPVQSAGVATLAGKCALRPIESAIPIECCWSPHRVQIAYSAKARRSCPRLTHRAQFVPCQQAVTTSSRIREAPRVAPSPPLGDWGSPGPVSSATPERSARVEQRLKGHLPGAIARRRTHRTKAPAGKLAAGFRNQAPTSTRSPHNHGRLPRCTPYSDARTSRGRRQLAGTGVLSVLHSHRALRLTDLTRPARARNRQRLARTNQAGACRLDARHRARGWPRCDPTRCPT